MSKPPQRLPVRGLLAALVLVVAFAWIGWELWRQWGQLARHHWQVSWPVLALSLVPAGGWFLLRGLLWQQVLSAFGCRLDYGPAFRSWALSEVGRYLPGKVWYVAGRAYLCRECGVPMASALMAMAVELALVVLTAAPFLAVRLVAMHTEGPLWPLLAGLAALAVLASPLTVMRLATRIVRLLQARVTVQRPEGSYQWFQQGAPGVALPPAARATPQPEAEPAERFPGAYLGMLGTVLVAWGLLGLGFALFARATAGASWTCLPALILCYPSALVAGMAAVVTPGGLGVREGVLAALVTGPLPTALALPVALLSRIWITTAEVACATVALRIARR